MILTRDQFLEGFLAYVKRELEKELPGEDFESSYMRQAEKIIYEKSHHIFDSIRHP